MLHSDSLQARFEATTVILGCAPPLSQVTAQRSSTPSDAESLFMVQQSQGHETS